MTSISLEKFNASHLSVDDNVWDNNNGSITTLLYRGDKRTLLTLPKCEVKYGCQDYKGNEKYTMTLTLDTKTLEQIEKIEKRLSEIFEDEIHLANKGTLKLKMLQSREGEILTRIYDADKKELDSVSSSIPKNSIVRVALHLKSVFKSNLSNKHHVQLFASQVMVNGVEKEEEPQCVF